MPVYLARPDLPKSDAMREAGPMSDQTRLSAVIRGSVQGVGFRWSVLNVAQDLGLYGYVTNRPDGTVEVVAEGPPGTVAELEKYLHSGPRSAVVEAVEADHGAPTGEFRRFEAK
jgi:acylphosphatase